MHFLFQKGNEQKTSLYEKLLLKYKSLIARALKKCASNRQTAAAMFAYLANLAKCKLKMQNYTKC